jgi:DNA mismatch repair protein MutS
MEKQGGPLSHVAAVQALPLFAASVRPDEQVAPTISPILAALNEIDPENMSPKQALDTLFHLKTLVPGCTDEAR